MTRLSRTPPGKGNDATYGRADYVVNYGGNETADGGDSDGDTNDLSYGRRARLRIDGLATMQLYSYSLLDTIIVTTME